MSNYFWKYFLLKAETVELVIDRLLNENRGLQEQLEACRSAHSEDKD